ncbi:Ig-like domain-containing protein [candidate division KSB1 bacterium]
MKATHMFRMAQAVNLLFLSILLLCSLSCEQTGVIDPIGDGGGVTLRIAELSSSVPAVGSGGESALITLKLVDESGAPSPGGIISFSTVFGSITPYDTTNSLGIAAAQYVSGSETGIDTITAVVVNYFRRELFEIVLLEIDVRTVIQLSAESLSLISDGQQATSVTVRYNDSSGNPVANETINLFADFGTIDASVVTNIQGRATATYTSPPSPADTTARIIAYIASSSKISGESFLQSESKVENTSKILLDAQGKRTSTNNQLRRLAPKIAAREVINGSDTLNIDLKGVILTLTATPDSLSITEATTSNIVAQLRAGDTPLASKTITFSTNFGNLTETTAITDENGFAGVQLQSAQATGVSTLTAAYLSGISAQTIVRFISGAAVQSKLTVSANPTEIPADGVSTSEITVILTDSRNNPIPSAVVNFSTDVGRMKATAVTDDNGQAKVNIFSERKNGTATITAQFGDVVKTTKVKFSGIDLSVTADPDHVVADRMTESTITVTLKDAAGVPIESEKVELVTTSGTFDNDSDSLISFTDVSGELITTIKSNGGESALITAVAGGAEAQATVVFDQFITSFTPDKESFIANIDTVMLVFRIVDNDNIEQDSLRVLFSSSLGELLVTEDTTDANGEAVTYLTSNIAGSITVNAKVFLDGVSTISATAAVTALSSPPKSLRLIASPNVVEVNGGTSTITALVSDVSGNPVSSQTVIFGFLQGRGGGESIEPTSVYTDITGSASTTFTAGFLASQSLNDIIVKATIQEFSLSAQVSLTIAGEPFTLNTDTDPPPIQNADGSFSLNIISILSDINGNPVKDDTPVFYSSKPPGTGTIDASVLTEDGIANATLVYPAQSAGKADTIISTSGQISDTLIIAQLPGFVNDIIVMEPGVSSILANGISSAQFRVRLVDASNPVIPVSGVEVQFVSDASNSGSSITEDRLLADGVTANPNIGVASFLLKSIPIETDFYPQITISAGGIEKIYQNNNLADQANPLFFRGIMMTVDSGEDTVLVGGTTNINVVLKETTNKQAVVNQEVTFGSGLGIIVHSGDTDETGRLSIPYTAGLVPGLDTVIVTSGIQKFTTVQIIEGLPPSNIFLAADTSFIKVKGAVGRQSTGISATVTDAKNNPVAPGTSVSFTTNTGTFASTGTNSAVKTTNVEGIARVELESVTTPGIATITAVSGGITAQADLVTIQAGLPNAISVSADAFGVDLVEGNIAQITVAAIVKDVNGNPVASGTQVVFRVMEEIGLDNPVVTVGDNTGPITTNEFGIATAKLTYFMDDIGKSYKLEASAGGVTGSKTLILPVIQ